MEESVSVREEGANRKMASSESWLDSSEDTGSRLGGHRDAH